MIEGTTLLYLENGGGGYVDVRQHGSDVLLEHEPKVTAHSKSTIEEHATFESAMARAFELMFPELKITVEKS